MQKPELGLVDIELYRKDNQWFFELVYNVENSRGEVVQVVFPKVRCPFTTDGYDVHVSSVFYDNEPMLKNKLLRLIDDEVAIRPNDQGIFSKHQIIWKPEPKEMTLKEIEEQLGHPVKVVAEKEE